MDQRGRINPRAQKARILGADGVYTRVRNQGLGRRRGFSVQQHLMKLAHANVNGSVKSNHRQTPLQYTESEMAQDPVELTEMLDSEVQDSGNATV
jgi:hypothetical protein